MPGLAMQHQNMPFVSPVDLTRFLFAVDKAIGHEPVKSKVNSQMGRIRLMGYESGGSTMHGILRKLYFWAFLTVFASPVNAQSVSPGDLPYSPAGEINDYTWVAGASIPDISDHTVLRDGAETWNVDTPEHCRNACNAFLGCKAFEYREPLLRTEDPTCRLLSDVPALTVATGSHIYIHD